METVELHRVSHLCRARWRRAGIYPAWNMAYISVGTLAAGGWYVDVVAHMTVPTRMYPDRYQAWQAVQQAMALIGGAWERIPCNPTFGWQPGERPDDQSG